MEGRLHVEAEETLNDNDKKITVPTGVEWEIKWLWVEYTSSGTVGNRALRFSILDPADDIIYLQKAKNTQAASITEYYTARPTQSLEGPSEDETYWHEIPLPPNFKLRGGFSIRVWDNANIDAAADDMILQLVVEEREVG